MQRDLAGLKRYYKPGAARSMLGEEGTLEAAVLEELFDMHAAAVAARGFVSDATLVLRLELIAKDIEWMWKNLLVNREMRLLNALETCWEGFAAVLLAC